MPALRIAVAAVTVTIVMGSVGLGQPQQRPATLDDLVAEVRQLRAEMTRSTEQSMRAELLAARLALQEHRLGSLLTERSNIQQQLVQGRLSLAPFTLQLNQAQESGSEIFAPLRNTMEQVLKREQELHAQEAEVDRLIAAEQNRWADLNARLDEIEGKLPSGVGR